MIRTGVDGELRFRGRKVAKVRSWSLNIQRASIDDSCLGQIDKTFVPGMRSATGSTSVYYDPEDKIANKMLNSVLRNSTDTEEIEFVFNRSKFGGGIICNGFITNLSTSVNVNAAVTCEVSFQVSGKLEGNF